MALWHVGSRHITQLLLWRTGPDRFRVMQAGTPADFLTNYDYILFDRKYEGVLRSAGTQLQLTPVTVTDKLKGQVWDNYLEAQIRHIASGDEITGATPSGPAIYYMGENNVFVSDTLKQALQQVTGQKLEFSLGLSLFAA